MALAEENLITDINLSGFSIHRQQTLLQHKRQCSTVCVIEDYLGSQSEKRAQRSYISNGQAY